MSQKGVQDLINEAFAKNDTLEELKNKVQGASDDRDEALRALKVGAGIGPFVHPTTNERFQIVQRHQSFYFREAKS